MATGMRVGMEAIAAGSGLEEGAGGGEGYFHGLVVPLAEDPRIDELVFFVPRWYGRHDEWRHPKIRLVRCRVSTHRPRRVGFEQLALPLLARRHGLDVLFSPSNVRPLAYRGVNVLALHAIQHFLLGDDIGRARSAYLHATVTRSVRSADVTIAVTETLRTDAITLFGPDPARIVAVPMGPQPWVADQRAQHDEPVVAYRTADGSPYILCISRLYALKNHHRLIEGYAEADVPHRLVIVGGDADVTQSDLKVAATEAGVADRVDFLGRVPQAAVPGLYAGAAAVAYVSLYETFGHPVLEAFACGIPLLTSSRGATAEVAGGAALLADPESVSSIAAGLRSVALDVQLRERLVRDGHTRVAEFSWADCARGTVDAFERAIEMRRARSGG